MCISANLHSCHFFRQKTSIQQWLFLLQVCKMCFARLAPEQYSGTLQITVAHSSRNLNYFVQ